MSGICHIPQPRSLLKPVLLLAGLALLPAPSAGAAPQPALMRLLANPPSAPVEKGGKVYDLTVQMREAKIFNPERGDYDTVRLRAYVSNAPADSPLVGPTIEVKPGATLRIDVKNDIRDENGKLPPHCAMPMPPANMNDPHCFDTTNFHTHGLWVDPRKNGDNIFLEMQPGESVNFEYKIDNQPGERHPSGTDWYHPHVHGSTTLQVSSGMTGALIVRGNRKPTLTEHGDIDTLLAPTKPLERIMVFQQIAYACGKKGDDINWDCTGKVGTLDNYDQIYNWGDSGRYTSINGQVLPNFPSARVGQIERWRMIDGGVASTINVFIRKARPGAVLPRKLSQKDAPDWVKNNCTGEVVHQFSIATDGLTRSGIVERGAAKATNLQPGYREDVLLAYPSPGTYCIMDTVAPATSSVHPQTKTFEGAKYLIDNRQLLGMVAVAAAANPADQKALQDQGQAKFLLAKLLAASTVTFPANVARVVNAELVNGLRLTSFQPHADLSKAKVNPKPQELTFNFAGDYGAVATTLNGSDAKPFSGHVTRWLHLGTTDEWKMTSATGSHPFHIHVNPFQIIAIYRGYDSTTGKFDPKTSKDVSQTGEPDGSLGYDSDGNLVIDKLDPNNPDLQYADLKGQWKDTLFVKAGYLVVIRTHYTKYEGGFVLHCHILSHEDTGMMEAIAITKDGKPNPAYEPENMRKLESSSMTMKMP